jgi:hypothetical protein
MKLITELSYDFELHEDSKTKDMYAVGIFSSAELKNNNKRIYNKAILEREVGKVQEKVEKKCLWGELGHPPNPEVNPDKIALRTTQLEWRGNDLYGKAKILDTPMGQIAKTLVKEGQMGISSRGLGTVGDDGYVNEDFHLITWDLVTDPSNNPSWVNGIYEGTEFNIPGKPSIKKEPTEEEIREAQQYYTNHIMSILNNIELDLREASKLPKVVNKAFETFKRIIMDDHGEPLTPEEVKLLKMQIDRLAKGYKGM